MSSDSISAHLQAAVPSFTCTVRIGDTPLTVILGDGRATVIGTVMHEDGQRDEVLLTFTVDGDTGTLLIREGFDRGAVLVLHAAIRVAATFFVDGKPLTDGSGKLVLRGLTERQMQELERHLGPLSGLQ